jgi:serine phosphatase RsbU (regulator of sigma subunit)
MLFVLFLSVLAINANTDRDSLLFAKAEQGVSQNPNNAIILLNNFIKNTKNSKLRNKAIGKIGTAYYYLGNLDSAIYFMNKSKTEAVKNEYYSQAGIMSNNIGIIYSGTALIDTTYLLYIEAFEYFKQAKDKIGIIDSYVNIGTYYLSTDRYNTAIDTFKVALRKAINIKDSLNIATNYSNIAIAYSYLADAENTLKYNILASEIFYKINYYNYLIIMSNMGALYLDLEKYEKAEDCFNIVINSSDSVKLQNFYLQTLYINSGIIHEKKKEYNKAKTFYDKALKIALETGDIKNEILVYLNLVSLNVEKNIFNEALIYGQKALKLANKLNSKEYIASSNKKIGYVYNRMKKYKQAVDHLEIASEIYLEIDYLNYILDVYDELIIAYKGLNDYKNAFLYSQQYILYNDSINSIETKKSLDLLNTKYETEKKEKQIIEQQAELKTSQLQTEKEIVEKEKQQTQRNMFIVAFGLMIILAVFVFRSYKQKKKANILLAEQKEKIEEIHHEISESINYATRLQEAILPEEKILNKCLSEHFLLFKPKDKVSGDFYWWEQIQTHTIISVADCTGHGVPGAFMSMLGSSFLREIVKKKNTINTGAILNELRLEVIKSLKQKGEIGEQKDGMDMAIISINHETNLVQFSGANNPLYILTNRKLMDLEPLKDFENFYEIKPDKMPIAIYEKMDNFTVHEIQLEKGDVLYMFSDGYADQFGGPKGKKFKYKPFKRLLSENRDKPMKEQKELLDTAFEAWRGDLEQIDDVVVLGIKI